MTEIRRRAVMPFACIIAITLAAALSSAQQPAPTQQPAQAQQPAQSPQPASAQQPVPPQSAAVSPAPQSATSPSRGCLAVRDVGSHAVRNVMLLGVAGALISKKQYKVVKAVGYPAQPGQKFHGDELQTLQAGGTKIVILGKKNWEELAMTACQ